MDREEMDAVLNAFLTWIDENHPDAGPFTLRDYVDDFLDEIEEGTIEVTG